ncbi:MAG: hypothetical protein IPL61_23575 [Myxococcales bacterium]|nr:hypothetical protein [Myxococcales bacterium]
MRTALATLAILVAASAAQADPPADPPPADPPPPAESAPTVTASYGYQIVLGEFAGVALVGVAAVTGSTTVVTVGAGAWALGVPAIHAFHGNPGRAVASLALRQGLLWSGLLIGGTLPCEGGGEERNCHIGGALAGAAIGYGAAVLIDAVVLARERRPGPARTWTPTVAAAPGGVSLGVVGAF